MADTGFVLAGAGATVAGAGTEWLTPERVIADDASYATCSVTTSSTNSEYLKGSTFGLSLPADATIEGIQVQVQAGSASFFPHYIDNVNIGKDDSTLATPVTTNVVLNSILRNFTFGGETDLWGLTWSKSEIEASTFQARLNCLTGSTSTTFYVDAIWVKVFYTGTEVATSRSFSPGIIG
jgi:hypothetical protein